MNRQPQLQPSPKVRLRAIEPEDLDYLYRIENDVRLWGVGETNVPYSRYTLHEYVAHCSTDIYSERQVRMMIDSEEGETVGIIDLINFEPRHLRAEVGIVIDTPHRGKGYARAALAELINYARDVVHIHQLYAIASSANEESIKLFESMGFASTARMKDWLFDGKNYHDAVLLQTFL